MFSPRGGLARRDRAWGLIAFLSLLVTLAATACGVPLSEAEVKATASAQTTDSQASSLAAGASTLDSAATLPAATPTPTATVSTLASPEASPSASPSDTPEASPTAATPAEPTNTPLPQAVSDAEFESQALLLLNAERQKRGLTPLKLNVTLTAEARGYARLMGLAWTPEHNTFAHLGPDGSTPTSRFNASGYAGGFQGEALAAGYHTPAALIEGWLTSPSHAAILLSTKAVDIGIGHVAVSNVYVHWWVAVTASP